MENQEQNKLTDYERSKARIYNQHEKARGILKKSALAVTLALVTLGIGSFSQGFKSNPYKNTAAVQRYEEVSRAYTLTKNITYDLNGEHDSFKSEEINKTLEESREAVESAKSELEGILKTASDHKEVKAYHRTELKSLGYSLAGLTALIAGTLGVIIGYSMLDDLNDNIQWNRMEKLKRK